MTSSGPGQPSHPTTAALPSTAGAAIPATYRLGALDVMVVDLGTMTWDDAMTAGGSLGASWRLPDLEELKHLYADRDQIGGFNLVDEPFYWSSTHHGLVLSDHSDDGARWYLTFDHGEAYTALHTQMLRVRAVREAT